MFDNRVIFSSVITENELAEEMELDGISKKEAVGNLKIEKMYEGKKVLSNIFSSCGFSAKVLKNGNVKFLEVSEFDSFLNVLDFKIWEPMKVMVFDNKLVIEHQGNKFFIFDKNGEVPDME